MRKGFNPRTHSRCDIPNRRLRKVELVSIHAPTRGATCYLAKSYYSRYSFNPRTHSRCDCAGYFGDDGVSVFQSTHPLEVRPDILTCKNLAIMFQSTHPLEVRPRPLQPKSKEMMFQSTHPLEVRLIAFNCY